MRGRKRLPLRGSRRERRLWQPDRRPRVRLHELPTQGSAVALSASPRARSPGCPQLPRADGRQREPSPRTAAAPARRNRQPRARQGGGLLRSASSSHLRRRTHKLSSRAGRTDLTSRKAVLPARSGAAPGSPFCGSAAPACRELWLGRRRLVVGPAAMPATSVVPRASALGPLVRLGRGAFSALSFGDGRPPARPGRGRSRWDGWCLCRLPPPGLPSPCRFPYL
jgi:hypothetical protein